MSRTAFSLLTATVLCVSASLLLVDPWDTLAQVGMGLFGAAATLAVIRGRRFKFDPVLR